jgi:DNA-binding transcriptional MocR family regulator
LVKGFVEAEILNNRIETRFLPLPVYGLEMVEIQGGGFVLQVELPEQVDSLKLYERALMAGITIAPGPIFSVRKGFRNFIRLNAAFRSENIEKALDVLGNLAETMK